MTYAKELDELRAEIKQNKAGSVFFIPKVLGVGNVQPTSATYIVYDPQGVALQSSASATITELSSPVYKVIASVSAGSTATLDTDYRVDFEWAYGGETYYYTRYFDVVKYPFGPPSVSYTDMVEEKIVASKILERHGLALGFNSATAKTEMAAVYAYRARIELDRMLRDKIRTQVEASSPTNTLRPGMYKLGRPHMILNRIETLNTLERKLAMRLMFAADMTDREGTGASASDYRFYAEEVERVFRGIGPIDFDYNEDMVPDTTVESLARDVVMTRVQT